MADSKLDMVNKLLEITSYGSRKNPRSPTLSKREILHVIGWVTTKKDLRGSTHDVNREVPDTPTVRPTPSSISGGKRV